jgi:citrate lyase subunit beta/citryl-CoA lyase
MSNPVHPDEALYAGERQSPIIPVVDHYAGAEKLIRKALALQDELGPVFDVTGDCEDGAAAGEEEAHARMVAGLIASDANRFGQLGMRVHPPHHPSCYADIDILLDHAGDRVAHITVPKATSAGELGAVIDYVREGCVQRGIARDIPIHALVETHGALADVWQMAALPWMRVLDFGLMDFISAHDGAIPASAMRSPGQFEHKLLVRAKTEMVAAALAHGLVAAHNVCLDLKNPDVVRGDATRARMEYGFMRMWSIYPAQILPIVEAMRPDYSEAEDAAAVLLAAQAVDWGPIQYKGELYDRASYRYYWKTLQRARMSGIPVGAEAERAFFG